MSGRRTAYGLLLGALLVTGALLAPWRATAERLLGTTYTGTTVNIGAKQAIQVAVGSAADGPLRLTDDTSTLPGCQGQDVLADVPVAGDATTGTTNWVGSRDSIVRYTFRFGAAGTMVGAVVPGSLPPSGCPRSGGVFLLQAPQGEGVRGAGLIPGATYVGVIRPLPAPQVRQPRPIGTIVITAGTDGNIKSLRASGVDSSCAFHEFTESEGIAVEQAKTFRGATFANGALAGVVESPGQLTGAIRFSRTTFDAPVTCSGPWAEWTAVRVPDAPAVADRGRITSGRPPYAQAGVSLFVFGGGSFEELVGVSCPGSIRETVYWADDGAGGMVIYIPATQLTVVNAAWNRRFPAGVPPATPILGRCTVPRPPTPEPQLTREGLPN